MRQEFEMSEAQLKTLLDGINAARNTPLIALQCGMPSSPQEVANMLWAVLGCEMGFDSRTVEPSSKGNLFFSAEPRK